MVIWICWIIGMLTLVAILSAIFWLISSMFNEPDDMPCMSRVAYAYEQPFSLSDYYKRKEQLLLELERERATTPYQITLWFGLNGIRVNSNGTFDWISRKEINFTKCAHFVNNDNSEWTPQATEKVKTVLLTQQICQLHSTENDSQINQLNMAMEQASFQERQYLQNKAILNSVSINSNSTQCGLKYDEQIKFLSQQIMATCCNYNPYNPAKEVSTPKIPCGYSR